MAKYESWSKTPSIVSNGLSIVANGKLFAGLAFIFLSVLLGLSTAALPASIPVGTVDLVEGMASVRHDLQQSTKGIIPIPCRIQQGDKVYTRDEITTGNGAKVKISFINHSTIHLGGDSHLIVTAVLYAPQKSLNKSFFKLSIGKVRAVVEKFSNPDSKFEVETKTAVAGVVGTEEIISASISPETGKNITRVICQTGHLVVRSSDPKIFGEIFLESLEQSWIKENESPEEKSNITPDELEKLVRETTIAPEGKTSDKAPGSVKKEEKKETKSLEKNSSEEQQKKDESTRREPPPYSAGQQGAGIIPIGGESIGEKENVSDRGKDAKNNDQTTARQQGEGGKRQEFNGSAGVSPVQAGVSPVQGQELEMRDPEMKGRKPEVKSLLGDTTAPAPKLLENAPSLEITPGIDQGKDMNGKDMIGADGRLQGPDHDNQDGVSGGLMDDAASGGLMKNEVGADPIDVDARAEGNDLEVADPVIGFREEKYAFPLSEDSILKEIILDIEEKHHDTLKLLPAPPGPPQ